MNRIIRQFDKQFYLLEGKRSKGWDRIYVAVDIHETVVLPTWTTGLSTIFYEQAKEALQLISGDPDVCLILWSCSLLEVNQEYLKFFQDCGIRFDYINENPECKSTDYADFESKLYFSVGLDDKFGFMPSDWIYLYFYFKVRKRKQEGTYTLLNRFFDKAIFIFKIFKNKNEKFTKFLDKRKMFRSWRSTWGLQRARHT